MLQNNTSGLKKINWNKKKLRFIPIQSTLRIVEEVEDIWDKDIM